MAINYLRRVQARYQGQGQSDVERGIQAGQAIGKLLGGLGTAIQGAQKDALANKLMDQQSIAQDQPGGTQNLGNLGGGSQSGGPQPGPPGSQNTADPDPDPVYDPSQVKTFPNPATGNIEPLQGQNSDPYTFTDMPDTSVSSAINQQKTANTLQSPSSGASPSDFSLNSSDYSVGKGPTVGSTLHTGGMQELELQKEMLAMQMQKAQLAKANAPPKAPDPVDVALKQVRLAQARQNLINPKGTQKTAVDKTSLATNMDTEPVEDQAQLVRTYESTHGKGSFDDTVSAFNAPDTVPDPDHPGQTIPNIPKVVGNSVTLNPNSEKNSVTLQLAEAQTLAKQLNTRRIAQGLPPIPVPGQTDPTLGSTRANPIPVQTRLDGASIPRGKWIRTPTGQIIQRP